MYRKSRRPAAGPAQPPGSEGPRAPPNASTAGSRAKLLGGWVGSATGRPAAPSRQPYAVLHILCNPIYPMQSYIYIYIYIYIAPPPLKNVIHNSVHNLFHLCGYGVTANPTEVPLPRANIGRPVFLGPAPGGLRIGVHHLPYVLMCP